MRSFSKFMIGGNWRQSDQKTDVFFPFNGDKVAEIYLAGEPEVEDAVWTAQRGFEITQKLPAHQRYQILMNLVDLFGKYEKELGETMILEGGKTHSHVKAEVGFSREATRVAAEEAKRIPGEVVPMDWAPAGEGRFAVLRRFPIGTVLGITPFNFPILLAMHKVAPAIAAGNSLILKPASKTPLSSLLLAEMILEAGYPPEALSVFLCSNELTERMVQDDRIAYLSFTGSDVVGWRLKSLSGRKRSTLELGGNAAVILHEDANLDYAVKKIVSGGFSQSGQNCISVQRVYIHESVYGPALEQILDGVSKLKVGDPRDEQVEVGPMITQQAASDAYAKVQAAVAQGAKVLAGGQVDGTMFSPTVLAETTPEMDVNHSEMFAPVITVTPYRDFNDAVRLVDNSQYGLQAGVFTQDINRIMQAYNKIQVAALLVNDIPTYRMDQMPYGGVKNSGFGREGPKYAIEEMTEMRMLVINREGGRF